MQIITTAIPDVLVLEPRVFGDGIAVRQIMRITLTADHRLVDGEVGARFVNAVKRRLENAEAFRNQVPAG